jgi:hypothetical protein
LRCAIAIDVEEDAAFAEIFLELKSQIGMRGDEWFGDEFGGFENFVGGPIRFDGREDVEAFAAGRFDERNVAETFEVCFELEREVDDVGEVKIVRRYLRHENGCGSITVIEGNRQARLSLSGAESAKFVRKKAGIRRAFMSIQPGFFRF